MTGNNLAVMRLCRGFSECRRVAILLSGECLPRRRFSTLFQNTRCKATVSLTAEVGSKGTGGPGKISKLAPRGASAQIEHSLLLPVVPAMGY